MTPELRESADYSERKGALYDAKLKREAADTIERLQRENAALRQSIELCSGSCRQPVSTGE